MVVGQAITNLGPSFDFTFTIGPELDNYLVNSQNNTNHSDPMCPIIKHKLG